MNEGKIQGSLLLANVTVTEIASMSVSVGLLLRNPNPFGDKDASIRLETALLTCRSSSPPRCHSSGADALGRHAEGG